MINMNKKSYWKVKKLKEKVLFRIKTLLFKVIENIDSFEENFSFRRMILQSILSGGFNAIILAIGMLFLDSVFPIFLEKYKVAVIPTVDCNAFIDVVIGSIGVAGVILGLYCANISSIYSTRYANAPEKLAIAFQFDQLTRKCMTSIIAFIIFGFVIILEALLGLNLNWFSVIAVIIWAIVVLVSYSIAGNRTYQLSDVYRLADDSYRSLHKIIKKGFTRNLFATDMNFQNHYLKKAEKKIDLLKTIQKFGANENHGDNTTMVEFICKNLFLLGDYWKYKKNISKKSLWFRNEPKHKKWHLSSGIETELALQTGTALRPKDERNYWWFEDELIAINNACFEVLMEGRDYSSFYSCLQAVESLCSIAIESKEVSYYVEQIGKLKGLINKYPISDLDTDEKKKAYAGIVEVVSLLYLGIILESTKFFRDFNIEETVKSVIVSVDNCKVLEKTPILSGSNNSEFYEKIITEIRIEGHRITPTWIIGQCIAKEEYNYLNQLITIICDSFEQTFSLGKDFLEKKQYFESCILLSRFFEFESKLNAFMVTAQVCEQEFRNYQIDKELEWDEFKIGELKETYEKWKLTVPKLLLNSSSEFTLINWKNREAYPDFLGESYNHICEDAIDSIITNNINQFKQDYIYLSKLMLLYQEYIRTDFLKYIGKYRSGYIYYMYTSPIVEWALIGGLAILWGEFGRDNVWYEMVDNGLKEITNNDKATDLSEKIIKYIEDRDKFMFGISNRDILETDWNLRVANAIRKYKQYDLEYGLYGVKLKTDSKVLQAFCSDFDAMGFKYNPSEVFLIMCVNPLLPKEKKYSTKSSWEKEFYD